MVVLVEQRRQPVQNRSQSTCGRCGARMAMGYDEPECPVCGNADYSYTDIRKRSKSLMSAATRYVVRYAGDFPALGQTLAHVKLVRVRNRVVFAVRCPFCERVMDQSSLSGKRPDLGEQRYKCEDGHRVSLVDLRNGMLGWR